MWTGNKSAGRKVSGRLGTGEGSDGIKCGRRKVNTKGAWKAWY